MFFQIDDQLPANRKAQGLARTALRGDLAGPAALGMWTMAGAFSQASLTDGLVSIEDLISIFLNYDVATTLANKLVDAELWHSPGHDCERCPAVPDGHYRFHDWFALGYDRGDQVKTTRAKRKELKDAALIAAVWARDCIDDPTNPVVGLCRYCQKEVHRQDRKSDTRPNMDHVDPAKAVGETNVVLACATCNRKKMNKTPEQAGMTLHPAPTRQAAAQAAQTVSPTKDAETESPAPQAPSRTVEMALAGLKPQPVPDQNEDQSDIRQESELISDEKGIPMRAHTGAHRGRAGQGGVTSGIEEGYQPTHPSPSRSRNRRRRGKKKPNPSQVTTAVGELTRSGDQQASPSRNPKHHAGEAPAVATPGKFGSPWHGWSGPPSNVTETTCPTHGMEEPCRRCQQDNE